MTNSMDFRFNGPAFFQEIIDGSNFDEKFIKHKLSQAKAHHSALLDHIHNLETENFELKEEKENFLKQNKKNKSPLKTTPFTDNTTMNLMDTEVSVDLDETNATFVCNNGQDNLEFSYFDDNFASIAQNKASKGSRIDKENLNLVGEETMKINFLTKEIELLDEKQAAEEERDILVGENENLKNQIVELCEKLEDSQIALTNAHQTCDQKDRKMIDLESDLEVANEEIIKLNNKTSKYSEMEIKYNDMQKRMETMEIDYLDKKDKVKNGNNLFAEVDERRQYCENKAIEYRDEILKVRQQRDQFINQNTILKRKMTKLQELVDNGASAKSYNIDNDPYFINVQKSALHYRSLYQKLQYESHERLQMVEQLRLKFQEDWHFPYDQKKILSRFLDVDRKYKDLQLTFHEKSLEIAKSVKERDEMEYKLKVLEHFNKLPTDHKCFKMRDQGTDTEEFRREDEEEKAAAGECNQQ